MARFGRGFPARPIIVVGLAGPKSRAVTDAANGTDTVTRALVLARAVTDAGAGSDTVTRAAVFARAVTDAAGGADTLQVVKGPSRAVTDAANGTDTVTQNMVFARAVTDTGNGTDTVTRTGLASRAVSDAANGTDTVARLLAFARAVSDTGAGTDAVSRALAFSRAVTDAAGGVATVSWTYLRQITDTGGGSDAITTRLVAFARAVSDTASGSDAITTRLMVFARAVTDTGGGSDAITTRLVAFARSVTDTGNGTDAITTRLMVFARSVTDAAGGTSTFATVVTGAGAPAIKANPNWPLVIIDIDFSIGTGPPYTPGLTRFSMNAPYHRLYSRKIKTQRGRQYELDQVQAGTMQVEIPDPTELLNPDNPASPFNTGGNKVTPYRPIRFSAMWPNQPGSGNIYNGAVNGVADPDFANSTSGWYAYGTTTTALSTAQHFTGTQSLLVTQTSAGSSQSIGQTTLQNTAPGLTYTFSAWVYATAGCSVHAFLYDAAGNLVFPASASTSVQNTWKRIYLSWTSVDAAEQVYLYADGVTAPVYYVDACQLEFGANLTPFTTSGPTLYNVYTGFVERFPTSYDMQGMRAIRPLEAVDGLAIMSRAVVNQSYLAEISKDTPSLRIPYNEPGAPSVIYNNSGAAVAQVTESIVQGGAINYAGDTFLDGTGAVVVSQQTQDTATVPLGKQNAAVDIPHTNTFSINTQSFMLEFWARWSAGAANIALAQANKSGNYNSWTFADDHTTDIAFGAWMQDQGMVLGCSDLIPTAGAAVAGIPATPSGYFINDGTNTPDGQWHYYALTLLPGGASYPGKYVVTVTVDNQEAPFGPPVRGTTTPRAVGGNSITTSASAAWTVGSNAIVAIANLAMYDQDIGTARRLAHYARGSGNIGELPGNRAFRLLGLYWIGGPVSAGTGYMAMAPDFSYDTRVLLDVLQEIQESERGLVYVTADGFVRFEDRLTRYESSATSSWVFGENPAGASPVEYPYSDYKTEMDPTYTFSQANLTRPGNSAFPPMINATTQSNYGQRILTQQIQCNTDFDLTQAGIFYLQRYGTPRTRISGLVLDPAANPALWPVILTLEISQRVTVTRRVNTLTVKADYYVEQVSHTIDADSRSWKTELELSPVFVSSPWVLAAGVLGTSTVPVY